MPLPTLLAFIFLSGSILSLWIKRDPKIWGTLLCFSIFSGVIAGHITWIGLAFMSCLAVLWFFYDRKPNLAIFIALVCLGLAFKLRLLPGYNPFFITPKFAIGLENPLIGLFPLALLVPLAKNWNDWTAVIKGFILGCVGIALLAVLATVSGATQLDFKLPSYMGTRLFSNLILTSIPEEGFYRGFIQSTLSGYFKNLRMGKMGNVLALLLSTLLFSVSHLYWSPNLGILAFTFLAGLLYGSVYLASGRIESAILCHFLFNLIHMTFFSYHAM
jgi:membrane protease YdiL (CAAX protease family)